MRSMGALAVYVALQDSTCMQRGRQGGCGGRAGWQAGQSDPARGGGAVVVQAGAVVLATHHGHDALQQIAHSDCAAGSTARGSSLLAIRCALQTPAGNAGT